MGANTKKRLNKHEYAVIMAGGGGTRLWPLSRKEKPKQFQTILNDQSLLQSMYRLLKNSFPADHIFVQVPPEFLRFVHEQIPAISKKQLIVEPEARDTGPAFIFAAATLAARDPDATVSFLYSDHLVQTEEAFHGALHSAFMSVRELPDHLAMIGVWPLYPHTGLGYIEFGPEEKRAGKLTFPVHRVKSFVEKPTVHRAKRFTTSSRHLWNTGYKVVRAKRVLELFSGVNPESAGIIEELTDAMPDKDGERIRILFRKLPRASFEYLVTERSQKLLAIAADMVWADVGDWTTVHRLLTEGQLDNVRSSGKVESYGCKNTLLVSNHRPIVAVGLKDLIVIETKDVVLVLSKKQGQELKNILKTLLGANPALV